jgi:hypothetical protein
MFLQLPTASLLADLDINEARGRPVLRQLRLGSGVCVFPVLDLSIIFDFRSAGPDLEAVIQIAGIPVEELNRLELEVLRELDFALYISHEEFSKFSQVRARIALAGHTAPARKTNACRGGVAC